MRVHVTFAISFAFLLLSLVSLDSRRSTYLPLLEAEPLTCYSPTAILSTCALDRRIYNLWERRVYISLIRPCMYTTAFHTIATSFQKGKERDASTLIPPLDFSSVLFFFSSLTLHLLRATGSTLFFRMIANDSITGMLFRALNFQPSASFALLPQRFSRYFMSNSCWTRFVIFAYF